LARWGWWLSAARRCPLQRGYKTNGMLMRLISLHSLDTHTIHHTNGVSNSLGPVRQLSPLRPYRALGLWASSGGPEHAGWWMV
jgi:hypothetical protein